MDKRLLEYGWGGLLTLDEAKYIQQKLFNSPRMRRMWKMGRRKRPPLTLIAEKAFPENPKIARKNIMKLRNRAGKQHRNRTI